MALVALQLCVPAGQREPDRVVIETRRLPGRGGMALLAGLWEPERDVVRIACFLEVRQVAADAGGRRALVPSACMAGCAIQGRVRSRQGKSREFQVIELRAQPGVNRMALFALDGEPGGDMTRCVRLLVGVLVTGVALDGESLELPNRLALMAVRTVQSGVPTNKREPVVVLSHLLKNDAPALDSVALFAVRSHLSAMDVGMAIRAVGSGIREHRLGMTLGAGHPLVQAA